MVGSAEFRGDVITTNFPPQGGGTTITVAAVAAAASDLGLS